MKLKPFLFLLVIATVLVGLAIWSTREPEYAPPATIGKALLPDLKVNDVARLVVVNQGSTVTVTKVEGKWVVAEKHNYPANFDRVRDALIKLTEIKIGDEVTGGADVCRQLAVVDPSPSDPDATQVDMTSAGGKTLASLLLGKSRMHKAEDNSSPYGGEYPTGRYVSPDGGANIYVVKDALTEFTTQAPNWINTELLNVDASLVTRLAVTGPDREPIELTKQTPEGTVELPPLAPDEEADTAKLSALRNALAYFNMQDIADPALKDADLGMDKPVTLTEETSDGRVFRVLLGNKTEGEARYVRCQVEYREPEMPPPTPPASTNAEDIASASAAAETNLAAVVAAHAVVRKGVETLTAQLAPWTFVVPGYKTDAMLVTRKDLVTKKAPEAQPKEADLAEPLHVTDAGVTNSIPEESNE